MSLNKLGIPQSIQKLTILLPNHFLQSFTLIYNQNILDQA